MNNIKFSHRYPKLWEQTTAELLDVREIKGNELNDDLLEYDTRYIKEFEEITESETQYEYYPLDKNQDYLQLLFLGDKRIPFCTIRRKTPTKMEYYKNCIGKIFNIIITNETN